MATVSPAWVLSLAFLLFISRDCYSLQEFEDWVDLGEPHVNPSLKVHRITRQVESDSTIANVTTVEDNHNYYAVKYHQTAAGHWVDLTNLDAKKHPNLSTNPRLAAKIPLEFDFPFYGHNVSELFLTTGGFMYLGSYVHRYLAATQYIAPLMANFDPAKSPNCTIRYFTNQSHFIAEWNNIQLGDNLDAGLFAFQGTLKNNGEITFAYKDIPIPLANISDEAHPTKTGIADAFYIDRKLTFWIKKRTIFEYHKVEMNQTLVSNFTAVTFSPLPTCNLLTDCESCTSNKIYFNCTWCQSAGRCSDGFDRHRQDWMDEQCDQAGNFEVVPYNCPLPTMKPPSTTERVTMAKHPSIYTDCSEGIPCQNGGVCRYGECLCPTMYKGRNCEIYRAAVDGRGGSMAHAGGDPDGDTAALGLRIGTVIGSIVIVIFIVALVGWILYAYRNPNSNSGMFLIEVTRCRLGKKEDNGVGYHYHKPDDNEEVDIII